MDENEEQFDRLWAPWRLAYVAGDTTAADPAPAAESQPASGSGRCFLCAAARASAKDDRALLVLWRRERTVVVLNRYPYNNGHLLIAPKEHEGSFEKLPAATHAEITDSLSAMLSIAKRVLRTDGFNVGLNLGSAAGAGLPNHLHWHVVPRWNGDNNFMPTVAGARVISQSLDAAWGAFSAALHERSPN